MIVKHTFGPIYDDNSEILILGSMPSQKSREASFYYAHPQNRFWPLIEKIYHVSLTDMAVKIRFLHNNHIALWDTIESCDIIGSSDATIKNIKVNDIQNLIEKTKIKKIYCTGRTSFTIYNKYIYEKTLIKAIYLPSTSPCNAKLSLDELAEIYKIILQ